MGEVRAEDVTVETYKRAECHLCEWTGALLNSYQEANEERLGHMDVHRLEAWLWAAGVAAGVRRLPTRWGRCAAGGGT